MGNSKTLKLKKEEKEKSENIIKLDKQNKIFFGKLDIGKIVGFIIKINANFGSSKNNFASKILKNSLKNIAEVHVEKFNKTNFENINFEADGKIKWKKKFNWAVL